MHASSPNIKVELTAAFAGVIANIILGTSSLYWRALGELSPQTLLSYRVLISLITLFAILIAQGSIQSMVKALSWRLVFIHGIAAALVAINWISFIWASIHHHVIESGLGYLIAPFIALALGAFFLGDQLSRIRSFSLIVIAAVVGYLFIASERHLTHWVYLTIGMTWGGYACLKKYTTLNPFTGLFLETSFLALFIPLGLIIQPSTLDLSTIPDNHVALLGVCGLVSVIPLALFSLAATRLSLTAMGFLQFTLPLTQFIVALAIYRQNISTTTSVCFSIIGLGLVLIIAEPAIKNKLRLRPKTTGNISI